MEPINKDLLFVLHDVARLMRTRFDQRARAWGLTRAQCVILMRLEWQPGMCQSDMAAICEVEPITVARLVDRLESNGLVERRADPSDRRVHRLHLLPAARPILAEIWQYRAEIVEKLRRGADRADWDTALRVLLDMKEKLATDTAGSRPDTAVGEQV